jgi:hypothetical protein
LLEGAFNSAEFLEAPYYNEAYALWTIDASVPSTVDRVAIYIKIPGMFLFAGVYPPNPTGWANSLIGESGMITASGQNTTDPLFWTRLKSGSEWAARQMAARSERQKHKTLERIRHKKVSRKTG